MTRKEWLGVAGSVVGAGLVLALPAPSGLTPAGQRMAALFVVTLVLFMTEALPVAVTAMLAIGLQPIFGVAKIGPAIATAMSPVFYFVIAMFCIAQSFVSSGLDRRFALWLLARAGTDPRRVLGAFMGGTALMSTVISDVPCTALFMTIALGLFEKVGIRRGESPFAKSVMIGIPVAALIGGVGTPAGTSINVLGLSLMSQYGKVTIPFLHWAAVGLPMVVLLVPVAWWALLRAFPPEIEVVGSVAEVRAEQAALGPMKVEERKVVGIFSTMLVLWIASTWIKELDVVIVALLGATALFLPGIRLFGWKEVERSTGWDVLLMIAGVTSLGAASTQSGLAQWLVDSALGGLAGAKPMVVVSVVSAFTILIRLLLPIGPVVVAVVIPPIALLAERAGTNPAIYALPVVFTASCAFLLPLDAVPLVTYSRGYYGMLDMLKPGIVISIAWVVVMTAAMVLIGPMLGLG